MISPVNNIFRSIHRLQQSSVDKLNILTLCRNNEKYIGILCKTKHNFYISNNHPWNNAIENRPPNLDNLNLNSNSLDYIICHDRAEQYEEALKISRELHIPIIIIDMCSQSLVRPHHILENLSMDNDSLQYRNSILRVATTQHIEDSWNNNKVSCIIPLGIDVEKFKSEPSATKECLISIDNNTVSQVGGVISHQLSNDYPNQIIPTDHDNLQNIAINKSRYFVNTYKTITVKTLEAMSAGNVVICLKTEDTENFIENKKTGILIDDITELSNSIKFLEKSDSLRKEISDRAREKIINEHSLDQFLSQWSFALNNIKSVFYNPPI